jgi:hypothetical protein
MILRSGRTTGPKDNHKEHKEDKEGYGIAAKDRKKELKETKEEHTAPYS